MQPDDLSALGWHDVSDPADAKWPIRYLAEEQGVEWVLWVSPAIENPDGDPAPDQIWWESDAITASEFLVVAGYALGAAYKEAGPWLTAVGVVVLVGLMVAVGRWLRREGAG